MRFVFRFNGSLGQAAHIWAMPLCMFPSSISSYFSHGTLDVETSLPMCYIRFRGRAAYLVLLFGLHFDLKLPTTVSREQPFVRPADDDLRHTKYQGSEERYY